MFGLSFAELAVLVIVAIVVIGPKDLPKVLRKLGQWSGQLRRMAFDLRAQSGIDDVLNAEGLSADIHEIRKLARGELDGVVAAARFEPDGGAGAAEISPAMSASHEIEVPRERELPREGADSYGALPDTAVVYIDAMPASTLAVDPIYTCGIATPAAPAAPREDGASEVAASASSTSGTSGTVAMSGSGVDAHAATLMGVVAGVEPGAAPEWSPPSTPPSTPQHAAATASHSETHADPAGATATTPSPIDSPT